MKVSISLYIILLAISLITLTACVFTDKASDTGDVSDRECEGNGENTEGSTSIFYADRKIDFAWLIDSNRLVVSIGHPQGQLNLLTLTDGTGIEYTYHHLLGDEFGPIYYPVASPHEQTVVFSVEQNFSEQDTDNSDWGVYRFDVDTNILTPLGQAKDQFYAAEWVPTGKYVTVIEGNGLDVDYRNLSVDGSEKEDSILYGNLGNFVWHTNGRDIIYAKHSEGNIYQINTLNGETTQLTNSVFCKEDPTWSPDGNTIAYISSDDGRPNLYLADAHGKNSRSLIQSEGEISFTFSREYAWSPDGQQIAFSWLIVESYEKHAIEIYTINVNGSNMKQLTYTPGENESSPQWSPDGKRLAYLSYDEVAEKTYINVLTLADGHLIRLGPLDTEFPESP